jgi:hypothetical protein
MYGREISLTRGFVFAASTPGFEKTSFSAGSVAAGKPVGKGPANPNTG